MSWSLPVVRKVIEVVREAGSVIQEIRSQPFEVEQKGAEGPVTEADRAADALLKEKLLEIDRCGWLSEETADDRSRLDLPRLWIVDPLDGTKEFVKGIPEYSVAVALVDRGETVLGVVYNPTTAEMFWAARGEGAFRDDTPISVKDGRGLLASRSEMKRGEFGSFVDAWDIAHMGSIEYKLARIAAGNAAVTLSRGPKWEWDVCAGALIVQEAGGLATDVFGAALRYNQSFPKVKGILAGAPAAHGRALEQATAMGPSDRMREFPDVQ